MSRKSWTAEEDSFLKERWGQVTYYKEVERIAYRLNHTISEVRIRSGQLKIKDRFNKRGSKNPKCKCSQNSPNKPEAILDALLQDNFPGEYRFNGDYSQGVALGNLVPDFVNVNGRKQVIELFGDYFHSDEIIKGRWKRSEFGRKAVYSQLGFSCLVIWEHELKSLDDVVKRIRGFQDAPCPSSHKSRRGGLNKVK